MCGYGVWLWLLVRFLVWCGDDFVAGWFGFGLVLRCFWLALAGVALWVDWFLARWFGCLIGWVLAV